MAWSTEELLLLARAWQESIKTTKTGDGKGKQAKMTPKELNQLVFERFEKLSGGSSYRAVGTVATRKEILWNSYAFIRSFRDNRNMNGGVEWFSMSTSEQRAVMKTAGGKFVQPLDERVIMALDKFLAEEYEEGEESETESEGLEATESAEQSSEGDKYQKTVAPKKKNAVAKKVKNTGRRSTKVDSAASGKAGKKSALEEETGELLSSNEEKGTKPKRRRIAANKKSNSSDTDVSHVLEHQSQVLAEFLKKRAEERSREHERSRQEREADQKFWATETAKDRALLRELFTND
ncbi:unnamed protein product [Phytophthora lilii]|uniref:Unnamed protein product n=1 Tax=Phytophthora lilii TaxID=2077276 RepID=A0A9W6U6H4_9STRA|nr:unnamed protein product [Phytophthora lilii]